MKRSTMLILVSLLAATSCTSPPAVTLNGADAFAKLTEAKTPQFLVKPKPGAGQRIQRLLEGRLQGEVSALGVLVVDGSDPVALEGLLYRPNVLRDLAYVEPNWPVSAIDHKGNHPGGGDGGGSGSTCTTDPNAPEDFYYQHDYPEGLWGLKRIQAGGNSGSSEGLCVDPAQTAWSLETGTDSVRVAVVDTGIDYSHADLSGRVADGKDFVNNDDDAMDDHGHGTHVAGTIAAKEGNTDDPSGGGVVGVAWYATLVPVKVLSESGSGTLAGVANGILWASDPSQGNAKVINLSLGTGFNSQTLHDAVNAAWANGSVIVAAAGNDGARKKSYPAAYEKAIAVAATTSGDKKASWSNWGADWVDVAAPGAGIWSCVLNGGYERWSGTSMATPHVAGLAALVWSRWSTADNAFVRARIEGKADAISGTGKQWQWGRINAYRAIAE